MVFLLWAVAWAAEADWAGLRDTAGTLEQGDGVVRLPTGLSGLGLSERTELQVQPFDLYVWGPRLGVEHTLATPGAWTVGVAPSVGTSLGVWSTRATVLAGWSGPHHHLGGTLAADGRFLRQTILGDTRAHAWSLSRVDVPLVLTWDWLPSGPASQGLLRTRLRTVLYDEGDTLDFVTVTESWTHRLGQRDRLFLETGVSALVGRPSEHVFLGDYAYPLAFLYPRLDLWMPF